MQQVDQHLLQITASCRSCLVRSLQVGEKQQRNARTALQQRSHASDPLLLIMSKQVMPASARAFRRTAVNLAGSSA